MLVDVEHSEERQLPTLSNPGLDFLECNFNMIVIQIQAVITEKCHGIALKRLNAYSSYNF